MRVPKTVKTYCPKCKTHTEQAVTLYKTGKARALAEGARRHERKKKGYGGQKFPRQRRFAKTTKKQTLKFRCKICGFTKQKNGMRLRKLALE